MVIRPVEKWGGIDQIKGDGDRKNYIMYFSDLDFDKILLLYVVCILDSLI